MNFGKVAVLMGGRSSEREVSLMSGNGVLQALQGLGLDAIGFDPAERSALELKQLGVSHCFIALHGPGGEDGSIQGLLEWLDIAYTGPGVAASAIAMNKITTKVLWHAQGLPTPAWRVAHDLPQARQAMLELGLPVILKAAHEGSTLGIARVFHEQELEAAFATAHALDHSVLVEQFIDGDEVTCAVLGTGAQAACLPIIQIKAPQGNYDYQHKYFSNDTQYECPCALPASEQAAIADLVLAAYQSLGCRGWSRADLMIRKSDRQAFLIELNTSPGMTGHSLVPMAAKAMGLDYPQLCLEILKQASTDRQAGRS